MSHELEIIEGEAQILLRENAWHRLGKVVGAAFTWLDAMSENLSITWPVLKVPMGDLIDDEFTIAGEQYVALREHDNVILASGIGESWASFYPELAYDFVTFLRDEYGMEANLESLGTIRHGRQWFMSFTSGKFDIGGYDVTSNLTASGSYDMSWPFQVTKSETIAVCANTIAAVHDAGQMLYRFKNTSGMFDRVEEAKRVVAMSRAREIGFKQLGERLLGTVVGENAYRSMVDVLFPVSDDTPTRTRNVNSGARDKVRALYTAQEPALDVVQGVEGTGWAFVQAVNTYENWGAPIRKQKGFGEATTRAYRQIDSIVGGRQELTDKALELVLA